MIGARLSELLATKWEDINFSTATWNFKTSLHLDKELRYYLDGTKTKASERKITLNKSILALIRSLQKNSKSDFIFVSPLGDPFPNRTVLLKNFYKYMKKADVKKIRFHDLRHSHVALLIDMQEQDFIIKERMSHASIKITYDIYGHLFPSKHHELAEKLSSII
jgi:Site-specific recombinase XerD